MDLVPFTEEILNGKLYFFVQCLQKHILTEMPKFADIFSYKQLRSPHLGTWHILDLQNLQKASWASLERLISAPFTSSA